MKKKHRMLWLNRGWQPVWFGFCPTEKAWKHAMRRLKIDLKVNPYPDTDARCTGFNTPEGKTVCIVTLHEERAKAHTPTQIVCLLIHEAVHVWQEVRRVIGEKEPSAEFEAYAVQAIAQELLEAYDKTRSKGATK